MSPGTSCTTAATLGLFEQVDELVLVQRRGLGQEIEVEVPSDDRRRGEDLGGLFPESRDPGADDGPHAVGKGQLALGVVAVQRPVASWTMAPDSDRWRSTSATKKGLPSVSR